MSKKEPENIDQIDQILGGKRKERPMAGMAFD